MPVQNTSHYFGSYIIYNKASIILDVFSRDINSLIWDDYAVVMHGCEEVLEK